MHDLDVLAGHVFISYAPEDAREVDQLEHTLKSAEIQIWRDTADLWPGEDWRTRIRIAIASNALVFLACFSPASLAKPKSHQNDEISLAIDEWRKRPTDEPWLIPVRLGACEIPDRDIGGGRTLRSIQMADLFGAGAAADLAQLVATVRLLLRCQGSPRGDLAISDQPIARPGSVRSSQVARAPTFGLITALPEEFAAVRAMIDGGRRVNVIGDRADYIAGTLPSSDPGQSHQVVLTMLGEIGNDAASSACANLTRSFGSVRCVLMVGIAAGVPNPGAPERHVRLGDIVVSTRGIVEYDSATDQAHGSVPRRAFPRPSPLLERRTKMLRADETLGIRPWEDLIASKAGEFTEFARPPDHTDTLYASDAADIQIPHPDAALTGHRPGQPRVHYGLIASGDRSLRSNRKRDEIAAAHDVLAIEMEGKGVGNSSFSLGVEWLVIRGISDYADHHTTRRWRNYASLAAAAYARALLAECAPAATQYGSPGVITAAELGPAAAAGMARDHPAGSADVHNEISGGIFFGSLYQGRDFSTGNP